MSSPRGSPRSGEVSPRTPSALRNELAAAKKAVEVLKQEKLATEEKLEKLHAVLDKERNALRDVLAAARTKVDELTEEGKKKDALYEGAMAEISELTQQGKMKDEEIERLKALLKNQKPVEVNTDHFTLEITQLKTRVGGLQDSLGTSNKRVSELESQLADARRQGGAAAGLESELARLRDELAKLRELNKDQANQLNSMQRAGGDKESLMKQLTSLREQLQSQSKLFSDQMDASRKREEDLRQQLVKQRQDSNAELSELRQQLSRALENENAYKVEQLSRMMIKVRHECALRLSNIHLLRHRNITFVCFFHFWAHFTQQANAEKRLSAEARYKLETARLKAEGKSQQFGLTPLDHKTHMQTRHESFDTHRYELWENMTPRGGRGDGRDGSMSSSPRSSPSASPASPAKRRPPAKFGTAMPVQPMGRSIRQ